MSVCFAAADGSVPPDSVPKMKKYSSVGIFIPIVMLAALGIVIDIILLIYNHQQEDHK